MGRLKTHTEYETQLLELEIDYWPLDAYIGAKTPIIHECLCGNQWRVSPTHILSKKGCPKCRGGVRKTHNTYIEEIKDSSYECLEQYINWCTPIKHKCKEGHIWAVAPNNILKGQGCPSCAKFGFDYNKAAILYYIKVGDYYKVGVTNRSIEERFHKEKQPIEILGFCNFEKGSDAKQLETLLLNSVNRITVPNYLRYGGNTELFKEPLNDSHIQRLSKPEIPAFHTTKL